MKNINANENYKQLGYAVAVQAITDFFNETPVGKSIILKQLKSKWMNYLTNDLAWRLAEELEKNPKEVKRRFRKAWAEELARKEGKHNG